MKFCIKNIKVIEEFEYEINDVSVIAGYNGTGKTTNALALYFTFGKFYKEYVTEILREESNHSMRSLSNYPSYLKACDEDNTFDVFCQLVTNFLKSRDIATPNLIHSIVSEQNYIKFKQNFYYKHMSADLDYSEYEHYNFKIQLITNSSFPMASTYKKVDNFNTRISLIKNLEQEVFVKRNLQELFDLLKKRTQIEIELVQNKFVYTINNKSGYSFSDLSSGQQSISSLFFLVASGKIDKDTILIIDEPETHMHPDFQYYYVEIIYKINKLFGTKILINTHSPYIIQSVDAFRTSDTRMYLTDIKDAKVTLTDCTYSNTDINLKFSNAFELIMAKRKQQ